MGSLMSSLSSGSEAKLLPEHLESFETLFRPGQILVADAKLTPPKVKVKPDEGNFIRVMQWNLLADGLSQDGFVTKMMTQEFLELLRKEKDEVHNGGTSVSNFVPILPSATVKSATNTPIIPRGNRRERVTGKDNSHGKVGEGKVGEEERGGGGGALGNRAAKDKKTRNQGKEEKNVEKLPVGEKDGSSGGGGGSEKEAVADCLNLSAVYCTWDEMIKELKAFDAIESAAEKEEICRRFVNKYNSQISRRNLDVLVAFRGRLLRYLTTIQAADPDILTVQELDHFEDVSEALSHLGYTSMGLPPRKTGRKFEQGGDRGYIPLWRRERQAYLKMLRDDAGRCFAPKENSTAFAIAAERLANQNAFLHGDDGEDDGDLAAAAAALARQRNSDPILAAANSSSSSNIRKIRQAWRKHKTNNADLPHTLRKIGVTGPLDDDGAAIFWKKDRFEPLSSPEFGEISRGQAAVKIHLRDKSTGREVVVATAHLKSGIGAEAQISRSKQMEKIRQFLSTSGTSSSRSSTTSHRPSNAKKDDYSTNNSVPSEKMIAGSKAAVAAARSSTSKSEGDSSNSDEKCSSSSSSSFSSSPPFLIFCMDGNSEPLEKSVVRRDYIPKSGEAESKKTIVNTYRQIGQVLGLQTCWDSMVAEAQKENRPIPAATVNKIRGPLSGQPKKIGKHALGVIDYVCYSKNLRLSQFAIDPLMLASDGPFNKKATDALIPSLDVPSDHYPVVVDLFAQA